MLQCNPPTFSNSHSRIDYCPSVRFVLYFTYWTGPTVTQASNVWNDLRSRIKRKGQKTKNGFNFTVNGRYVLNSRMKGSKQRTHKCFNLIVNEQNYLNWWIKGNKQKTRNCFNLTVNGRNGLSSWIKGNQNTKISQFDRQIFRIDSLCSLLQIMEHFSPQVNQFSDISY
jgi:predicted YcjX-like family ATPase